MRIIVCISNVPDTTTKIKLTPDQKSIESAGIQWVINPWDELSLTRALELKDDAGNAVNQVTVAHVGLTSADPTIRKALAIGADDAIRINADASDAYFTAFQLAEALKSESYDLVMCGIESSDHNGSAVGGMLSEFLNIPSVSAVSGLQVENDTFILNREIDGGKEVVAVKNPMVAIVQKGIAKEPRIASMRGIMTSRTKVIKVVEPVAADALTSLVSYATPAARAACRFVDAENPKELVDLLQNEAKVF
jgi:electron transfer flavoprotein beta subunit